jgi:hypothetical protein
MTLVLTIVCFVLLVPKIKAPLALSFFINHHPLVLNTP